MPGVHCPLVVPSASGQLFEAQSILTVQRTVRKYSTTVLQDKIEIVIRQEHQLEDSRPKQVSQVSQVNQVNQVNQQGKT